MHLRPLPLLAVPLFLAPLAAQRHHHGDGIWHDHHHHHEGVLTIENVLALPQNRGIAAAAAAHRIPGVSGNGDMKFEVVVTSKKLPKPCFAPNKFGRGKNKKPCLDYAHGGFAYDHREGKGEVYWFLQGAGIIRVHKDRSKIDLVETDDAMLKYNMHNATFFVHKGKGMIAWPANGGQSVFITNTEGKILQKLGRPEVEPYKTKKAGYAPTDTAYLDGMLWVTDGYASKFVMSYDVEKKEWTGTIFGGRTKKAEPGKFGTNHGITVHKGLIWVSGRYFARIHSYKPDTKFVDMFPLPDGSRPCDFEFFVQNGKLYGVAASLNPSNENRKKGDKGAAIFIVDMKTLKIVSTIKPKDELQLARFRHLHNVFPVVEDDGVTLFCQAWNVGDFAVLRQKKDVAPKDVKKAEKIK